MPPGNFIHVLLKTIGQEPLQQTKASCLRLRRAVGTMDQIHLLPQGEQQKGPRQQLLHVKAEDMAKECRKTSSSASQAFF